MRILKLFIWILILYAILPRQQFYLSSIKYENSNKAQTEVVEQFFARYNSPLSLYASSFLKTARENNLDYRLLPAIAMVESTGGRNVPSYSPFNVFGWGCDHIHRCWYFRSYDEAIDTVGKAIGRGRTYPNFQQAGNISELAKIYNISPDNWTRKVQFFIEEIK